MIPRVSIVVPVYNGEKTLLLCLDSLMALNYPKECLETIVVDNNSTDRTKDIIKRYPIKYIFEKRRSVSLARNRGIDECAYQFIAFIDADCIADRDWLKNIIGPLKDKTIGGIGGKILSYNPQNWIEKYIDSNNFYCQCGQFKEKKYFLPWLTTANAIFRKDVLREIGLFDSAFCLLAYEDVDLTSRVVLAGYNIRYTPTAIVYHKHRNNLIDFCKWHFIKGRAFPYLFFKYKDIVKIDFRYCLLKEIIKIVLLIKATLVKLTKNIFIIGNMQDKIFPVLDIIGDIAYFFGYFYGWLEVVLGIKKISSLNIDSEKGALWWNEGGGLTVVDLSQTPPKYRYLNEAGKRIWELLVIHNKSRDGILNTLSEEYEEDKDIIKADLQDFLSNLRKIDILKSTTN